MLTVNSLFINYWLITAFLSAYLGIGHLFRNLYWSRKGIRAIFSTRQSFRVTLFSLFSMKVVHFVFKFLFMLIKCCPICVFTDDILCASFLFLQRSFATSTYICLCCFYTDLMLYRNIVSLPTLKFEHRSRDVKEIYKW